MFQLMRLSWQYSGAERWRMVLFYVLLFIANLILVLQPVVLVNLIDALRAGGPDILSHSVYWCSLFSVTIVVFWIFHGPARIIERRLAFEIYHNFVTTLYRKVTEMPLRWHQDHHSGDTINRVSKAGKSLFNFSQTQFINLQIIVRYIGSVVFLGWYCWWVALSVVIISACLLMVLGKLDKYLVALVNTTNEREHRLGAAVYDYVGNIISVLTLRLQERTRTEIDTRFQSMRDPFYCETAFNEKKWFILHITTSLMQAVMIGFYIVVTLARKEPIILGTVIAIFQYCLIIFQVFVQYALQSDTLLHFQTDVSAIDPLLNDHQKLKISNNSEDVRKWKNINIRDLSFTHNEGDDAFHHLNKINMSVSAGQKIALIGSSGSSKTTLLTLLRGLYDAAEVTLNIDGVDFNALSPMSGFTTLVPQDSEVFENTIDYNLTFGVEFPKATMEEAIFMAAFDEVIPTLPKGIFTDIRERGVNLSGGQKQRLALARGLLAAKDSSLLLLDEPTSNVDLATEGKIFERVFATYADKAIITSVHRLHLLPRFDWIILMQDGKIVQQGTFAELTQKSGAFLNLWRHHLAWKDKETINL